MKTMTERKYTVEGHGQSLLLVNDGELPGITFRRCSAPLLNKRDAWEQAKAWMARNDLHTVKVLEKGKSVWRSFKTEAGWVTA